MGKRATAAPDRSAAARRVVASERDRELLRLVGEQCALTQPQLADAIGRSVHTARWLRSRWQRAGWVRAGLLLAGRPVFVWLTPAGQGVAGLDYRLWRPAGSARVEHIAACADARLLVMERRPGAMWVCERELLRRWRRDGLALHRPDAEVITAEGTAAVEVERTLKGRRRFERIAAELQARYEAAWYFAPPPSCGRLSEWARGAGLARIQVIELPDEPKVP